MVCTMYGREPSERVSRQFHCAVAVVASARARLGEGGLHGADSRASSFQSCESGAGSGALIEILISCRGLLCCFVILVAGWFVFPLVEIVAGEGFEKWFWNVCYCTIRTLNSVNSLANGGSLKMELVGIQSFDEYYYVRMMYVQIRVFE